MLGTLRSRLIASHILPLLIAIPVMGAILIYALETRVVLANAGRQLTSEAVLVAELARDHPEIWTDPVQTQAFVARVDPVFRAHLMLLMPDGTVLGSTDPAYGTVGSRVQFDGIASALAGQQHSSVRYSRDSRAEVAESMVAVAGADGKPLGVVRLSDTLETVSQRFITLRYLIVEILAGGLVLATFLGWLLALRLATPLRRVTDAAYSLSSGRQLSMLPEEGPAEIRRLFHAFNTLAGRLNALEEARRRLLANLVHELGRPLGAMQAATHALLEGADEDPELRRELIVGVDGEIQRLDRLLADLGEFQEQLLGTHHLQLRRVALDAWLSQVLGAWRPAAEAKGLGWDAAVPGDLPTVDADPDRLGQALGNLLSNAIKYTRAGGRISIDVSCGGGTVRMSVGDTGPGIAPEQLPRLFEPFYRGASRTRFPQGMGLGLAIARDLVTAHGGRLEVESVPGEGSCFTIVLPAKEAQ